MELFNAFKQTLTGCSYQINDDGTLRNKNCINEPITPASECETNPTECYSGINNGYTTTKKPLLFYKKTIINKMRMYAITEIVVPTGSDVCIENDSKMRVSMGVVGKQYLLDGDDVDRMYMTKSNSIYDRNFEYISGKVIEPNYFWSQKDERDILYPSYCNSGIHILTREQYAKNYNY